MREDAALQRLPDVSRRRPVTQSYMNWSPSRWCACSSNASLRSTFTGKASLSPTLSTRSLSIAHHRVRRRRVADGGGATGGGERRAADEEPPPPAATA